MSDETVLYAGVHVSELQMCHYRLRPGARRAIHFTPGNILLILNVENLILVDPGDRPFTVGPRQAVVAVLNGGALHVTAPSAEAALLVLSISMEELARLPERRSSNTADALKRALPDFPTQGGVVSTEPLRNYDLQSVGMLLQPPVPESCHQLWTYGKVIELVTRFILARGQKSADARPAPSERMEKIIHFMEENHAEPLSLDVLARQASCSPAYLSRTFRSETGKTISTYLREIRIRRAAQLLEGGAFNVTEAAYEVGYSSLGQFSRAFARIVGTTPAKYRQSYLPARNKPKL